MNPESFNASLVRDIGYIVTKELHEWDLYENPSQAFNEARSPRYGYMLDESEFPFFKEGAQRYLDNKSIFAR